MLQHPLRYWPLLVAALVGCVGRPASETGISPDYSVLTAEDVRSVAGATTLYDVIRVRRPRWFTRAKPISFRGERQVDIVIYLDNVRFGEGPDVLRQVHPGAVRLVQYLNAGQAEARFGQGHVNGAILVVTLP